MKFYKFVSWEVEGAETVIKRAKIPAAMIEADKGNYKPPLLGKGSLLWNYGVIRSE